jgi:hypothetical protein
MSNDINIPASKLQVYLNARLRPGFFNLRLH